MNTIFITIICFIGLTLVTSAFKVNANLNNTMINLPAIYTFSFTPSFAINSTDYLKITFPQQIQVITGTRNCSIVINHFINLVFNKKYSISNKFMYCNWKFY